MDYLLALLQGLGIAAAIGIRPFLPVLLVGALAGADLGVDFEGTDVRVPGADRVPARDPGRRRRARHRRAARGRARRGRRCSSIAVVLGALLAAGSLDDVSATWWPGLIVGAAAAALGWAAARSLFGRVRARLDNGAATALPLYAEGSALLAAGPVGPVPAAGRADRRGAGVAAARRPPAPGEKYAGSRCASPGVRGDDEARPRRHRRDEARDARAGRRDGPGADAQAPDRVRAARGSVRRRVPERHAGVRGQHRDRLRPRRARDPGDELVAPRRGALRRVRHELRRQPRVRDQAVAHGHDLQHEPRAPLARRGDGVRDASTTPRSAPPARRI